MKPSIDASVEIVATLSRHFIERWLERVGTVPSLESVNHICRKGQRIVRQKRLYRAVDGRVVPCKTLALWWNHSHGVIVWVDEDTRTAVTVVVPEQTQCKKEKRHAERIQIAK